MEEMSSEAKEQIRETSIYQAVMAITHLKELTPAQKVNLILDIYGEGGAELLSLAANILDIPPVIISQVHAGIIGTFYRVIEEDSGLPLFAAQKLRALSKFEDNIKEMEEEIVRAREEGNDAEVEALEKMLYIFKARLSGVSESDLNNNLDKETDE